MWLLQRLHRELGELIQQLGARSGSPSAAAGSTTTQPAKVTIHISSFTFNLPATVAPGATVSVMNMDGENHTVTADDGTSFDVKATQVLGQGSLHGQDGEVGTGQRVGEGRRRAVPALDLLARPAADGDGVAEVAEAGRQGLADGPAYDVRSCLLT